MQLLPHQIKALKDTEQLNRVAIAGFEGLYEVDQDGNVYSIRQGQGRRICKIQPYSVGNYLKVNLYSEDGKQHKKFVHRIVAETFIPNPQGFKEVNHIDCNGKNNSVENLEWCDRRKNLEHAYAHGKKRQGEKHGMHKLTLEQAREIKFSNAPQKELAEAFNVSQSTISAIQCGRIWKEVI